MTNKIFFAILSTFLILSGNLAHADLRGLPQITVLSESSLTAPITELARIYSKNNNITITTSFNSSSELARNIEEGQSADLYISSSPSWVTNLKQQGLIDVYSITNLVKNKIVLAVSRKSRFNEFPVPGLGFFPKLSYLNNRTIMVVGDPYDTALGKYTEQAVKNIDEETWESLKNKTIKAGNAKNALYLISHGETAGILYYSDAYQNNEINIINIIDDDLHDPIIYQAAVVAGENMEPARKFLDFLQLPAAHNVLKKHGFIVD